MKLIFLIAIILLFVLLYAIIFLMKKLENNKYKGDGLNMITAQGNCEKDTGNKF